MATHVWHVFSMIVVIFLRWVKYLARGAFVDMNAAEVNHVYLREWQEFQGDGGFPGTVPLSRCVIGLYPFVGPGLPLQQKLSMDLGKGQIRRSESPTYTI